MVYTALPFFFAVSTDGCTTSWKASVSATSLSLIHTEHSFFQRSLSPSVTCSVTESLSSTGHWIFLGERLLESTRLWQPLFGVLAWPEEYRSSDIILALFTGEIWTLFQRAPRFQQSRVSCLGRLRCSPRIDFPGRLDVPVSTVDTVHRSMYGGIHGEFYQCST